MTRFAQAEGRRKKRGNNIEKFVHGSWVKCAKIEKEKAETADRVGGNKKSPFENCGFLSISLSFTL